MPPLFVFLAVAAFAGAVYVRNQRVAAKNVLGQNVPIYERDILGFVGDKRTGFFIHQEAPSWTYGVIDLTTGALSGPLASAASRKDAFNAILARFPQANTTTLQVEFVGALNIDPLEYGAPPVASTRTFTMTVLPTQGGYMTQVLDPRAVVELLKTYQSFATAVHEGYAFVSSKGY